MSDEEVERFEITDYDLENEFNLNRPRKRMSKNQAIYGIWAQDSDEEDARPSFGGGSRGKNYSAPVSFISGGLQQNEKKKEIKKEPMEVDEEEGSTSEEEMVVPQRRSFKSNKFFGDDDLAGFRHRPSTSLGRGIGDWEKYTKGIGAKLLLQMGYQPGRGLGKDLQGISAPVEAHQRKGRGAIGLYGPEPGKKQVLKPGGQEELPEQKHVSQWRKNDGSKKKKVKYIYKSVEEVLEEGKLHTLRPDDSSLTKVKVIDMTGPKQKVFSGYHVLGGNQKPDDDWDVKVEKKFQNFAMPELLHNLDLVVDMCEKEIIQSDRKLHYSEDRLVTLEQEEETLSVLVDKEQKQIISLQSVLEIVAHLDERRLDKENPLTLQEAATIFKKLQRDNYEEYKLYDLGNLAVCIVAPLLKQELANWKPLEDAVGGAPVIAQWKDILDMNRTLNANDTLDPYHKILWDAWMPKIREAVSTWECRKCEPMIEFLEHWLPLTPSWILDNICDQLILPKIQAEVSEWNPLTDTVPIHAWIHPWLPLLGSRLEIVYPVIRHKLSNALTNWHPSDPSAKMIIQPWLQVFSAGAMNTFLIKNIVPKLQIAMQEFVINPHKQHLDHWNWVKEWEAIIPLPSMVNILDKFFFTKWLQVLATWLNHTPNYEEVTNWYSGWKRMFSEKLLGQPLIREHFRKALDMMNRSVTGVSQQPGAMESVSYLTSTEREQVQSRREYDSLAESARIASQIPQGFKELIEKRCEEKGLIFVPIPNRWHEAKQVYRCGNVQMYIDRHVAFVFRDTTWVPVSMQSLLDMAS